MGELDHIFKGGGESSRAAHRARKQQWQQRQQTRATQAIADQKAAESEAKASQEAARSEQNSAIERYGLQTGRPTFTDDAGDTRFVHDDDQWSQIEQKSITDKMAEAREEREKSREQSTKEAEDAHRSALKTEAAQFKHQLDHPDLKSLSDTDRKEREEALQSHQLTRLSTRGKEIADAAAKLYTDKAKREEAMNRVASGDVPEELIKALRSSNPDWFTEEDRIKADLTRDDEIRGQRSELEKKAWTAENKLFNPPEAKQPGKFDVIKQSGEITRDHEGLASRGIMLRERETQLKEGRDAKVAQVEQEFREAVSKPMRDADFNRLVARKKAAILDAEAGYHSGVKNLADERIQHTLDTEELNSRIRKMAAASSSALPGAPTSKPATSATPTVESEGKSEEPAATVATVDTAPEQSSVSPLDPAKAENEAGDKGWRLVDNPDVQETSPLDPRDINNIREQKSIVVHDLNTTSLAEAAERSTAMGGFDVYLRPDLGNVDRDKYDEAPLRVSRMSDVDAASLEERATGIVSAATESLNDSFTELVESVKAGEVTPEQAEARGQELLEGGMSKAATLPGGERVDNAAEEIQRIQNNISEGFLRGEVSLGQARTILKSTGYPPDKIVSDLESMALENQTLGETREAVQQIYKGSYKWQDYEGGREAKDLPGYVGHGLKEIGRGIKAEWNGEVERVETFDGKAAAKKVFVDGHLLVMAINSVEGLWDTLANDGAGRLEEFDEKTRKTVEKYQSDVKLATGRLREKRDEEVNAFLADKGLSDEAVEQLRLSASRDAAVSLDKGFTENLIAKANNPAELLPFINDFAMLEPLLPVAVAAMKSRAGEELSPMDEAALNMYIEDSGRDHTALGMTADILSQMPAFVAEIALTGGIATGVKKLGVKGLAKVTGKEITEGVLKFSAKRSVAKNLAAGTARGLNSGFATFVQTPAAMGDFIAAETFKNMVMPDLATFQGSDSESLQRWASEPGQKFGPAFQAATFDAYVEMMSEKVGGPLNELGGMAKADVLKSFTPAMRERLARVAVVRAAQKVNRQYSATQMARFMRQGKFGGTFEEMLEERVGDVARAAGHAVSGGAVGEEFEMPTGKQILAEFLAFGAPNSIAAIANSRAVAKAKKQNRESMMEMTSTIEEMGDWSSTGDVARGLNSLIPVDGETPPVSADDLRAIEDVAGPISALPELARMRRVDEAMDRRMREAESRDKMDRLGNVTKLRVAANYKHAAAAAEKILALKEAVQQSEAMQRDPNPEVQLQGAMLSGAVKVVSGRPAAEMTQAERMAWSQPLDEAGTLAMEEVNGRLIITDAGRKAMAANFGQEMVDRLAPMSESKARRNALKPDLPDPAPLPKHVKETPETSEAERRAEESVGARSNWTATGVDGTQVSIPGDAATTVREAERLLARQLKGEMLDTDSVAPPSIRPREEGGSNPVESEAEQGSGAPAEQQRKPLQPETIAAIKAVAAQSPNPKAAETVGTMVIETIEALNAQAVFSDIKFAAKGSGAAMYVDTATGALHVDLERLTAKAKGPVHLGTAVMEEVIHAAAIQAIPEARIAELWQNLTPALKKKVIEAYTYTPNAETTDSTDVQLGHEFLRMVIQDRAFRGLVTEAMAKDPSFAEELVALLRQLVESLRALVGGLDADTRANVDSYADTVIATLRDLGVNLPESSDGVSKQENGAASATESDKGSVVDGTVSKVTPSEQYLQFSSQSNTTAPAGLSLNKSFPGYDADMVRIMRKKVGADNWDASSDAEKLAFVVDQILSGQYRARLKPGPLANHLRAFLNDGNVDDATRGILETVLPPRDSASETSKPKKKINPHDIAVKAANRLGPYAFPGGIEYRTLDRGQGMMYDPETKSLVLDPQRLAYQHEGSSRKAVETAVNEEFIHRVATELFTDAEIAGLWETLPDSIKDTVRTAYWSARVSAGQAIPEDNAAAMGHEFLRMLVQNSEFAQQITESTDIPADFLAEIAAFLQRLAERLNELVNSAPAEVQGAIRGYETQIVTRIRQLTGESPAAEASPPPPAPRQSMEPQEGPQYGSTGNLILADGRRIPFQYELAEAGDIYLAPENDRDYQSNSERAANEGKILNFQPELILNNNPTADTGPSIVDLEGEIQGGNRREILSSDPRSYPAYREYLAANAAQFGLDPAAVESMERPKLIRRLLTEKADLNRALNDPAVGNIGVLDNALSSARLVDSDVQAAAASLFEQFADSPPLAALQSAAARDLSRLMLQRGIIRHNDRGKYLDDRGFTDEGARLARYVLLASVVKDKSLLSAIADGPVETKMIAALPALSRAQSREVDISPMLDVIRAEVDRMETKGKKPSIDEYYAQQAFDFDGSAEKTEAQQRLHRLFAENPSRSTKKIFSALVSTVAPMAAGEVSLMGETNRESIADITDAEAEAIAGGKVANPPQSGMLAAAERKVPPRLPSAVAYDTLSSDESRVREQLQDPETARLDYLNYRRGSTRSDDDVLGLGEAQEIGRREVRESQSAPRQAKSPVDWARKRGLIIPPETLVSERDSSSFHGEGQEHTVFLDKASGRIVKVGRWRFFGVHHPGSFEKYLERWALSNIELGSESMFHGFVRLPGEHYYAVVVSDRFIKGREAKETPEDRTAIDDAMRERGYRRNGQGASYTNAEKGIRASDAIAKNFIITESREAVPIDLNVERIEKPEEDANQLTLFAAERVAPPAFYSRLARVIEEKIPNRATPQQILATVDPSKGTGVKAEEIKWSGLESALDRIAAENDGKVPKDELLQYLADDGAVRFEEVDISEVESDNESRYGQYTLPGGENYREVVLALPERNDQFYSSFDEYFRANFGEMADPDYFMHEAARARAEKKWESKNGKIEVDDYAGARVGRSSGNYTSSHFDDAPNYVAHMRTNERPDAEGRPGLFIEEIQSDRHQEGRKKGYKGEEQYSLYEPNEGEFRIQGPEGKSIPFKTDEGTAYGSFNREVVEAAVNELNAKTGIPDAPFRKDWPLQMFKRALRDAVESGKDWIGWTVGETQNERFDLSKQVDSVSFTPWPASGKGMGILAAYKDGEQAIKETIHQDKLQDYIGKDVAERLLNSTPEQFTDRRSLEGSDLKVGGSGMKGFYDGMLPKEIQKYVKQWGGKVEKSVILNRPAQEWQQAVDAHDRAVEQWGHLDARSVALFEAIPTDSGQSGVSGEPIWRVTITPQMKDGVTQGQPLFAPERRAPSPTDRKMVQGSLFEWTEGLPLFSDVKAEGSPTGTSPASPMDRRNQDSRELFADDGGFRLQAETTQDGEAIARRREEEEASAQPADSALLQAAAAPIEDFGEKLGGARKDMEAQARKEFSDDDLANLPLSKIWPKPDLSKIDDDFIAAAETVIRALIPAKPRVAYKKRAWVEKVKNARELITEVLNTQRDEFMTRFHNSPSRELKNIAKQIDILEALPREQWARIESVAHYPDAYRYGEQGKEIPSPYLSMEVDGRRESIQGITHHMDALPAIRELLGSDPADTNASQRFEVRGRHGSYKINRKGDGLYRPLKTFTEAKEALAYVRSKGADLDRLWEALKERENVKKSDVRGKINKPRRGADHRGGRLATPEMFSQAFGFRGVEFGNWVSQGKNAKQRQGMLDLAYDSLMDLAAILDIPPQAVSLNGELGLAFGSRGSGSASAHYEPGSIVINLTKTRGAGTLAHEWFHALDNYLARQRNDGKNTDFKGDNESFRNENYLTHRPRAFLTNKRTGHGMPAEQFDRLAEMYPERYNLENWEAPSNIRPEVEKAFADLMKALGDSPMARRAVTIDKGRSGGYWSRPLEIAARGFENYTILKMAQEGYHNDYLANVVGIENFARDPGRYPYLLESELPPVEGAFSELFSALEVKETDRGMALYAPERRAPALPDPVVTPAQQGQIELDRIVDKLPPLPHAIYEGVTQGGSFAEVAATQGVSTEKATRIYRNVEKVVAKRMKNAGMAMERPLAMAKTPERNGGNPSKKGVDSQGEAASSSQQKLPEDRTGRTTEASIGGRRYRTVEPSQLRREIDFEGRDEQPSWTEPEPSPDWDRLDRQEVQLEDWAREHGFLIDETTARTLRDASTDHRVGNEHRALLFPDDGWVVRTTIGNKLGLPGKTPSQYLKRWEDSARFSPQTAAMFLGFSRDAQGNGVIWTAQRFESGREPTPDELVNKMNGLGFETGGGIVFYRDDGIKISDANPDNVKVDDDGNLRFIDVWVEYEAPNNILRMAETPRENASNSEWDDHEAIRAALDYLSGKLPSVEVLDERRETALNEADGERTVGNPDIANVAEQEDIRREFDVVREAYDMSRKAETHDQWNESAHELIKRDADGVMRALLEFGREGVAIDSPVMVKAAQIMIPRVWSEANASGDPKAMRDAQALTLAYQMGGTLTAQALSARRDPHKTPAERHLEMLANVISKVPPAVEKAAKLAPTPAQKNREIERLRRELKNANEKETSSRKDTATIKRLKRELAAEEKKKDRAEILGEAHEARLAKIEEALREMGITLHEIFNNQAVVRLRGSEIVARVIEENFSKNERAALRGRIDKVTPNQLKKTTGLSKAEILSAQQRFKGLMRKRFFELGKRGLNLMDFQQSEEGLFDLSKRIDKDGSVLRMAEKSNNISDDQANAAADEMMDALFGDEKSYRKGTARKPSGSTGGSSGGGGSAFNPGSRVHTSQAARVIQSSVDSNGFDAWYEYWINNILGGPETQVVNIGGNSLNAILEYGLQRPIEAAFNTLVGAADGPTLGEYAWLKKALPKAIAPSVKHAVITWLTEESFLEADLLRDPALVGEPMEKVMGSAGGSGSRRAIRDKIAGIGTYGARSLPGAFYDYATGKGWKGWSVGRTVRIPTRMLLFMDTLMKGITMHTEVAAVAYRKAKAAGLKGEEMENFIHEEMGLPGSDSWYTAAVKGREITFTTELKGFRDGGGMFEQLVRSLQKNRVAGRDLGPATASLVGWFFPFIQTPFNIFRAGLRRTPFGMMGIAANLMKAGLYSRKKGSPIPFLETYSKARMVRDMADQTIAWITTAILLSLTEGDDDDDDKSILITGSRPWGIDSSGERQLLERGEGGPFMLRVGKRGPDAVYFDYGRMEPFATILASIADSVRAIKRIENGADRAQEITKLRAYAMSQAQDKTFLQGIVSINEMLNPSQTFKNAPRTFVQAVVPNIVRQPLRNLDDYVRDTKTAPWYYHALPVGGFAEPKYDLHGNPVKKSGTPLGPVLPDGADRVARIFTDTGLEPAANRHPADTALINWNRKNPHKDDQYFPSSNSIREFKDLLGNRHDLSATQVAELNRRGGQKLAMMLRGQISPAEAANPTIETINKIQSARRRVFTETRDEIVKEPKPRSRKGFKAMQKARSLAETFGWNKP